MENKLKIWNEAEWDLGAKKAAQQVPLKGLSSLPKMVGITPDAAKNLKWKSLKYMLFHPEGKSILKNFFKHPFQYGWRLLSSSFKSKPYQRDGDFFFYGIDSTEEFSTLLHADNTIFVIGFSYCHKPFECPSGRFTDQCIRDPENPVCRQCFIGKIMNLLPEENVVKLAIPTVHYIGNKIFETVHANPTKKVVFLITACELTLEMFGDWGNMAGIKGIGVRLDGRICNTMRAFELSEEGIKPGLTVVLDASKRRIIQLFSSRQSNGGTCEKVCED